jgi:hypothetical protein
MAAVKTGDTASVSQIDGESFRILDEMDRLLGEMQDTMKVIKRMFEVETPPESDLEYDKVSCKEPVHSS